MSRNAGKVKIGDFIMLHIHGEPIRMSVSSFNGILPVPDNCYYAVVDSEIRINLIPEDLTYEEYVSGVSSNKRGPVEELPAVLTQEMVEEAALKAMQQSHPTVLRYEPPELICEDESCECKCED